MHTDFFQLALCTLQNEKTENALKPLEEEMWKKKHKKRGNNCAFGKVLNRGNKRHGRKIGDLHAPIVKELPS